MEMLSGSREPDREWETSGTEEDVCCCGREAGSHRLNTMIPFLQKREARLQRVTRGLAAVVLLLATVTAILLIVVVHGGRGHQSPDSQHLTQLVSSSSDKGQQQKTEDSRNPSAMLTVSKGNNTFDGHLDWESEDGYAFCQGGFNYSRGNLVVPRKGIYRVFLQITYESKEDHHCDQMTLANTVFVFQNTYTRNLALLSSVDRVRCMEPWSKSLYSAGLFALEAGCRLSVKSSHPELIVRKQHLVFFGAELAPQ